LLFGWWLALAFFVVALLVSGAEVLGGGRGGYGKTLRGLAWYIGWPFGKYVEGEGAPEDSDDSDEEDGDETVRYGASDNGSPTSRHRNRHPSDGASSGITVRDTRRAVSGATQTSGEPASVHPQRAATTISFAPSAGHDDERVPLIRKAAFRRPRNKKARILGRIIYWPLFVLVVAPIMLFVCVLCWGLVFTIPMAKLTWVLIKLLATRPLEINFRAAPRIAVQHTPSGSPGSLDGSGDTTAVEDSSPSGYIMKQARLKAGQVAPTAGPTSTVLLCVYRAMGVQYYKYTIMGVNIIFIDLLPLIFFTIADDFIFLPAVERGIARGHYPSPFIAFLTSQSLIFVLSLASVIPLSYFIGMAVASISAQSSIGMGAVINATFGSIIEIILYSIALVQGKGRLVEGSIVGSILAGVLLMPGLSMLSGALKRKEQKFNAKSAGVTSTMLIMATIGTLTPTMFYQIYGSVSSQVWGGADDSLI
jgi:Ca2+:H+ antiporter